LDGQRYPPLKLPPQLRTNSREGLVMHQAKNAD
jgi:hypothetical protein